MSVYFVWSRNLGMIGTDLIDHSFFIMDFYFLFQEVIFSILWFL